MESRSIGLAVAAVSAVASGGAFAEAVTSPVAASAAARVGSAAPVEAISYGRPSPDYVRKELEIQDPWMAQA